MADIFTKSICKEGIPNIWIEANEMCKLKKDNGLEILEISVLFYYRKLISNCWYYLSIWTCLLIK